jgi:glycosyltransferase involved in cell wall biosynthesis
VSERLLVVTPVRNEEAHIARVVEGMAAQTRPPDCWIVVDDRSTDRTAEILGEHAGGVPFLRVVQAPEQGIPADRDRLAAAAEAVAFNWGIGQADEPWDFASKLDGDIVLDPGHYEFLLARMREDPKLGMASGYLHYRDGGRWVLQPMPDYHVAGPLKLYRRECLEGIARHSRTAGVPERLSWETIDETYARMDGWGTRSFRELRAEHLKPPGSAGGHLRGKARHGESVYVVHYPAWLVVLRALRTLHLRPYVLGSLWFGFGYFRALLRRRPAAVEDPEFRRFSRAEQRARLRGRAP